MTVVHAIRWWTLAEQAVVQQHVLGVVRIWTDDWGVVLEAFKVDVQRADSDRGAGDWCALVEGAQAEAWVELGELVPGQLVPHLFPNIASPVTQNFGKLNRVSDSVARQAFGALIDTLKIVAQPESRAERTPAIQHASGRVRSEYANRSDHVGTASSDISALVLKTALSLDIRLGELSFRMLLGVQVVMRILLEHAALNPLTRPAYLKPLTPVLSAVNARAVRLSVMLASVDIDLGSLQSLEPGDVIRLPHLLETPVALLDGARIQVAAGALVRLGAAKAVELQPMAQTR